MSFRDIVSGDISSVFLETSEFAENKTINGIQMPVVEDDNILRELEARNGEAIAAAGNVYAGGGLFRDVRTIYVSEKYMSRPKRGALLTMDNQMYTVISAKSNMGMIEIELQKHTGR